MSLKTIFSLYILVWPIWRFFLAPIGCILHTKVILTQKSIEFIGIQPEPIETLEIGIYLHLQIIYETYVLRARVRFCSI